MIKNDELQKDVIEFVKSKIQDVMCVEDIPLFHRFQNYYSLDISRLSCNLLVLKKILQLNLNLYNNYDMFRQFPVKFVTNQIDIPTSLGSCYRYEEQNDVWICSARPGEGGVVDALFNYLLCAMSAEIEENTVDNVSDEEVSVLDQCSFCTGDITPDADKCNSCEEPLKNIKIFERKQRKMMNNNGKCADQNVTLAVEDMDNEKYGREMTGMTISKREDIRMLENIEKSDVLKEDIEDVDGYKIKNDEDSRGRKDANKGAFRREECESFYSLEYDEKVLEENIGHRGEERWKCGACELLNCYEEPFFCSCNSPMEERGLWLCKGCTFWNKFTDSRCSVCFTENHNIVVRYCQYCKKTKIAMEEQFCYGCVMIHNDRGENGHWRCRFSNCGAWTTEEHPFCTECGLWRFTPFEFVNRGDNLRRSKHGYEEAVWMCARCRRFNDTGKGVCGGWFCKSTRYGKRKCAECGIINDGKTNICDNCCKMIK